MITSICIALIFLAAGFIQGLSGFGSALIAMPLLTMLIDVKAAVPLCILNGLIITSYLSLKMRGHMERKKIAPLLAGSIPGIFIGVYFLKNAEPDIIRILLGILIVSYGVYSLLVSQAPRNIHPFWSYLAGFGTGFIGSAFSAGGPPVIIYTTLSGWSRDHIKATLSGFFFASSIITVTVYIMNGLMNTAVLKYFSVSALFVFMGVYGGSKLYSRFDREGYIRIILMTLILLGLMMLTSGL
jgi:uncharacterized membrane protein YfcA